ncbi:hypothetical protein [Sphingomonas astaxanthinifaciens]|nr:hypothetical protein [Sphingomonas astaxanthinifaciens]
MTQATIVTLSALIALFAGLYTLVVFTRRRRDAASTTASTPKD